MKTDANNNKKMKLLHSEHIVIHIISDVYYVSL